MFLKWHFLTHRHLLIYQRKCSFSIFWFKNTMIHGTAQICKCLCSATWKTYSTIPVTENLMKKINKNNNNNNNNKHSALWKVGFHTPTHHLTYLFPILEDILWQRERCGLKFKREWCRHNASRGPPLLI